MLAIEIQNVSFGCGPNSARSAAFHTPADKCLASFVWGREQHLHEKTHSLVCILMHPYEGALFDIAAWHGTIPPAHK